MSVVATMTMWAVSAGEDAAGFWNASRSAESRIIVGTKLPTRATFGVMQLLIVRHGIAEERETWAPRNDDLRPLTEEGKKKMKEAAKGLHALVPKLEVLASSPLTRAVQTATILAKEYDKNEPA